MSGYTVGKESPPQQGIWESISLSFPTFFTLGNPTPGEQHTGLTMTDNYGTVTEIPEEKKKWTWGAMIIAAIGQMCCVVCGVPALIFAILSYIDNMRGEYNKFIKRKRYAIILGLTAIICGIIFLAFLSWAAHSVSREAEDSIVTVDDLRAYVAQMRAKVDTIENASFKK